MLRLNTTSTKIHPRVVSDLSVPLEPARVPEGSTVLEGFLRRDELALQLGLSPRTIDRWQAFREGPPRVRIGRTIFYNIESVREWLRSHEQQFALPNKKLDLRSK